MSNVTANTKASCLLKLEQVEIVEHLSDNEKRKVLLLVPQILNMVSENAVSDIDGLLSDVLNPSKAKSALRCLRSYMVEEYVDYSLWYHM